MVLLNPMILLPAPNLLPSSTKALTPAAKRPAIEFKDVQSNFWAYAAIQSAYKGQFVSGYPDGTFKPQQQIPQSTGFSRFS